MREGFDELRTSLAKLGRAFTPTDVAAALRAQGRVVTDCLVRESLDELRRNSIGAGPLDELLNLPDVSDVVVNGASEVFVDRGAGLERAELAHAIG